MWFGATIMFHPKKLHATKHGLVPPIKKSSQAYKMAFL